MNKLLLLLLVCATAHAEPFTYQGKLDVSGSPANGNHDFRFNLLDGPDPFTANTVATVAANDVSVNNGYFTVELDFGTVFDGSPYWLEVYVRPGNSTGGYSQLLPTQPIQAAPEAQVSLLSLSAAAGSIDSAAIADGSINIADTDGSLQRRISSSCAAGSSIRIINADGTVSCETDDTGNDWSLAGNSLSGTEWLGSSNNQPVEIRANGRRVLHVQDALDGSIHAPNILAGAEFNEIATGVVGATVAGGGGDPSATGCGNGTQTCVNRATAIYATVSGGWGNTASGWGASVGGGLNNTASGDSAVIPGGTRNRAGGHFSLAAGRRANVRSTDYGTFVWADATDADFTSSGPNQFLVQASGGVWFGAYSPVNPNNSPSFPAGSFLATSTGAYLTTGGTWTNSSDKNRKENFEPVDGDALLEKIASLPIRRWNYRDENDAVKHIGPTAQDFHAAFGLGHDDRHITTVDADGVALAAIQALLRQLQQERERNNAQSERIRQLTTLLGEQQQKLEEQNRKLARLERQQTEIAQLRNLLQPLLAREGLSSEEVAR